MNTTFPIPIPMSMTVGNEMIQMGVFTDTAIDMRLDGNEEIRMKTGGGRAVGVQMDKAVRIDLAGGETYEGPYTVDPDFEGQILDTNRKVMTDDVTVNAIEVQRVSNLSGGVTVYIGGIINV